MPRTVAATLAHMYPHAAYLVLRRDPRSGELRLDSLRTAGGGAQSAFAEGDLLPELTDPVLRTAWGQTNPRDPRALLRLLRGPDRPGTPFGRLPDSAREQAGPYGDTASLLCLVVNAEAPEAEGHDRKRLFEVLIS